MLPKRPPPEDVLGTGWSPVTMFGAVDSKTMKRASPEMEGSSLSPFLARSPLAVRLMTLVVLLMRSRRNTSHLPFVSFATRFDALDSKAM